MPAGQAVVRSDALANSYLWPNRFDPERPYIQMIVPRDGWMAVTEAKPSDFGNNPMGNPAVQPTSGKNLIAQKQAKPSDFGNNPLGNPTVQPTSGKNLIAQKQAKPSDFGNNPMGNPTVQPTSGKNLIAQKQAKPSDFGNNPMGNPTVQPTSGKNLIAQKQAKPSDFGNNPFSPPTTEPSEDRGLIAQKEAKPFHFLSNPFARPTTTPKEPETDGGNANSSTSNKTSTDATLTSPATLMMLVDGMSVYPYPASAGQETVKSESLTSGAYELAYVAHRPRTVNTAAYPRIHHADYNPLSWGGPSNPLSNQADNAGAYELVYIYRPVIISTPRDYDVYHYFQPAEQNAAGYDQEAKVTEAKASEIAMPDAEDYKATIQVESSAAKSAAEAQEKTADTAEETAASQDAEIASEKKSDAAAKQDLTSLEQEVLEQVLELQNQRVQQQDEKKEEEEEEKVQTEAKAEGENVQGEQREGDGDLDNNWEELENVNNRDLLTAVERVLQQLHNRLLN